MKLDCIFDSLFPMYRKLLYEYKIIIMPVAVKVHDYLNARSVMMVITSPTMEMTEPTILITSNARSKVCRSVRALMSYKYTTNKLRDLPSRIIFPYHQDGKISQVVASTSHYARGFVLTE